MSDNAREIFIKNLRYIMEKKGISQADICRSLKIPSATMSNWFTGLRYPRIDKMQQLADMLGVTYSTLTTENGLQDYEDQQRLEALHQDPRLGLLFDRTRRMSHDDVEFMLQFADRILKERDGDD
jgi:transcriptional regulator with XRE-family HTH domain